MRKGLKAFTLVTSAALVFTSMGCATNNQGQQGRQQNGEQPQRIVQPARDGNNQVNQQDAFGDKVVQTGKKYLGTPYLIGGEYETSGRFDCSSFTQYVFKKNGVDLPRRAEPQAQKGTRVSKDQLQKGDLLFFKLKSKPNKGIEHVGIYAGNGKILHTYGEGGVRIDDLDQDWLQWGYLGATRVRPNQ